MNPLLQAEYSDGYVHSEKDLNDTSQFVDGKNVFHDIYEGYPEKEHGQLKRLTLFYNDRKYEIDWTLVPAGARPIRVKHMTRDRVIQKHPTEKDTVLVRDEVYITKIIFGYQYNDADGKSIKVIKEL